MTRQYNNFKYFLTRAGYSLEISLEDFKVSKLVIFKCIEKHITTLTCNSFKNKRCKSERDCTELCSECKKNDDKIYKFEDEEKFIFDSCGHELLSINDRKNVIYRCFNCGEENKTWLMNLHSNKGCCPKCQNEQFKNTYSEVEERLEKFNIKLINYTDYHNLDDICICGKEFKTSIHNIERGRLCL